MGKLWYIDPSGKRKRTEEGVKSDYRKFQSSEEAKKDRAARNTARRRALRSGRAHKGDNTAVDHIDSNPRHNDASNLRVISRSRNAGRKENSRRKGSRRNRRTFGL